MRVDVTNTQCLVRINAPRIIRLAKRLMTDANRLNPDSTWGDISVVLMDNAGISKINRRLLGKNSATDVIALRFAPVPGERTESGEIWINVQRAVDCAGSFGWDASREMSLYLAHGCDHLHGQDDSNERGSARMRRRELAWLKRADRDGLLSGLLRTPEQTGSAPAARRAATSGGQGRQSRKAKKAE
jgi:rRNA maturation RNase YbeY